MGTEAEIRVNSSLAARASPFPGFGPEIHPFASFVDNGVAILADQKRSPLFDRKERNEEQAQIVVNPFKENLYLLTGWTWPCLLVQYFSPWLNPSDEEKHHLITGTQYLIPMGNLSHNKFPLELHRFIIIS